MEKLIKCQDGTEIGMRSTGLTPFRYREWFNRDLAADMNEIKTALKSKKETNEQLTALDINIFLNVAYTMSRMYEEHKGNEFPRDPFEWLDSIDAAFTIYDIAPQMFELWADDNKTLSTPRKK